MPKTRSAVLSSENETLHQVAEEDNVSVWSDDAYADSDIDVTIWTEDDKDIHVWLKRDVKLLVAKIHSATLEVKDESCLKIDSFINWEEVKFGRFTPGECMKMWSKIKKKVRTTRSVEEYWCAANELVYNDATAFLKFQKPMSAEELYIEKKLNNILEENSEMDEDTAKKGLKRKYRELSDDRKEKYIEKAKKMRKIVSTEKGKSITPKPPLPVDFFLDMKLSSFMDRHPEMNRAAARNECKQKFKNLKDEKKLKYINKAIDAVPEYMEELEKLGLNKDGKEMHFLTKDEIRIKKIEEGIPPTPPLNGYSMFTLQVSHREDFDKTDLFTEVSRLWKTVSDEEKERLRKEAKENLKQYNSTLREILSVMKDEKRNLLTLMLKLPSLESLSPDQKKKRKPKNKKMTDYFQNMKKAKENSEDTTNGTEQKSTPSESVD